MDISPDVIAVGHICLDTICLVDGYPPEDTSRHIEEFLRQPGGAASQAAAAARRLGGSAGYMGMLGDDEAGRFLLEDLDKEDIGRHQVKVVEGGQTSFSFVVSNRRSASRTLFSYHDRLPPLDFSDPAARAYIAGAKCVHLDGTMYENARNAARTARECGVTVSLDGCSMQKDNEKNLALVRLADILVMNETYPLRLTGLSNREQALLQIAEMGPRIVASTSGSKGCMAVRDGRVVHYPAYLIHPVDTTGAGDVFHGAFLLALLENRPFEEAIRFASAAAAINCLTVGGRAGIPGREQVLRFMGEHRFG